MNGTSAVHIALQLAGVEEIVLEPFVVRLQLRRTLLLDRGLALLLQLRTWLAFRKIKGMASWSAEALLDHFFQGPEIKAIFTGILADFVVLPSEFPGLGIPGCNPETSFDRRIPLQLNSAGPRTGYCYVIGGVGKVVEAMAGAISASGGKIETDGQDTGQAQGTVLQQLLEKSPDRVDALVELAVAN